MDLCRRSAALFFILRESDESDAFSRNTAERPRPRAGRSSALRFAQFGAARAAWGRCSLGPHTPRLLPPWCTVGRCGCRRGRQQTGTPRSGISASEGMLFKGSSEVPFLWMVPLHVQLCLLNARPLKRCYFYSNIAS